MNILIDLGHPAHVHLYRNLYSELAEEGHRVHITTRDIPAVTALLDKYRMPFHVWGKKSDAVSGKILKEVDFGLKMIRLLRKEKIDLAIGSSMTITHASRLTRAQSIVFDDDDDEVQPLFSRIAHPISNALISPEAVRNGRKSKKAVFYPGYHELAYLHPSRFKPDPAVLHEARLEPGEQYFVLRFNVFKAHHDIGVRGLNPEQKRILVSLLSERGRVFITTERDIDPEFKAFGISLPPDKIHSLLYYATMFLGDSQTMTSEAAVLGTPAIRCNTFVGRISYLEELELKYGLTYGFAPEAFDSLLVKVRELQDQADLKETWARKRKQMLRERIDLTALMKWIIVTYPASISYMHGTPDFTKFIRNSTEADLRK